VRRTEIMEGLMNCQYLWLMVVDRAKTLLYDYETAELSTGHPDAKTRLDHETNELISGSGRKHNI